MAFGLVEAAATAVLRLSAACEGAHATGLDVALTVPLHGRPTFALPERSFGAAGEGKHISRVEMRDAKGVVPTTQAKGGDMQVTAKREVSGPVTLRYRVKGGLTAQTGSRFGLRGDDTGVGGLGAFFLMLPETEERFDTRVEWGEVKCMPGAQAFSSFDNISGSLEKLRMAAYFVGKPITTRTDEGTVHMRTAWFGHPSFDVAAAGAWAAKVFAAEHTFFGDTHDVGYQLFVRVLPEMTDQANGMGQPHSILTAIGPDTTLGRRLHVNLAHEMLHRWIGLGLRLGGPEGSNFWFSEGFTVYYTAKLLRRHGLIPTSELAEEIESICTKHFDNPRITISNDTIRLHFFEDEQVSLVPYTRGALYAAELDANIQARGQGRSLDDVMRELWKQSRAVAENELGLRELAPSAFKAAVVKELGPDGGVRFDNVIMKGVAPLPASTAFGPCFKREAKGSGYTWTRDVTVPESRCSEP